MIPQKDTIREFFHNTPPFNKLAADIIEQLLEKLQPRRYRMGQAILTGQTMPSFCHIIVEGQVRILGKTPEFQTPLTLQLLKPGAVLGWISLVRQIPCETAIASSETFCLSLPAADFLTLINTEPVLTSAFSNRCTFIEAFELLSAEMERQAIGNVNIQELANNACSTAVILSLPPGKTPLHQLDPNRIWLLSGGAPTNFTVGSKLSPEDSIAYIKVQGSGCARLVGFIEPNYDSTETNSLPARTFWDDIPYSPTLPPEPETAQAKSVKYPYVSGTGSIAATNACFEMVAQYFGMPFRRDVVRRVLIEQFERNGTISIQVCGAIADMMGLASQMALVPAVDISRLQTPALLQWQDSYAVLFKTGEKELVLAVPSSGIKHIKQTNLFTQWKKNVKFYSYSPQRKRL